MPKPKSPAQPTAVAFLRGVNVGGNRVVPMAKVAEAFGKMGFDAVKSIGHAGNILFDGGAATNEALAAKAQKGLLAKLKLDCVVIVRQLDELRALVKSEPFGKPKREKEKFYVAFFATAPTKRVKLPLRDDDDGYDLFELRELDLFARSWPTGAGYAFPNLDKLFGVAATMRNLNTVVKLIS